MSTSAALVSIHAVSPELISPASRLTASAANADEHKNNAAANDKVVRARGMRCLLPENLLESDGPYRSRTDTPLRAQDFESSASANSAKRPRSSGDSIGGKWVGK